ncbi:MAG: autotransporter-associated beta strand repeat-containing protein, partial [Kiritimatiellae bacterium]|nr:autotransporter-associated beta strand repeat-containing protein [Kiritimatiellia bacterium]
STSTSAGVWNFWGGKQVLVGTRGTANERVDFFGYCISNNAATLIFSNAVIRTSNDFIGGSAYNHLCHTTLVNCDKNSTGGWDYGGAGYTNTTFTIIGGTFARSSGNLVCGYTGSRVGTCVVTNGATVTAPTFWTYPGGVYRQYDGTSTFNNLQQFGGLVEMRGGQMNLKSGEQHVGTSGPLGPSAFAMYGGTVYVSDGQNMQIGSYSKGWFHQEGGEVSVPNYFAVGRYAAGVGLLDVHGGTFTHRNQNYLRIAEDGTGTVSVANGGTFVDLAAYSPISQNAAGKGTAILSPDGTFETPQFRAGAAGRNSSVVFNGGTMKLRTNGYPTSFLDSTISRVTVSPYGGAIDTNGKGDFTLNRALGPTTDAGDLSEALAHRWSFKNGSLVDSVGGLTATVGGTVDLEDGAVRLKGTARGTSCVNLGTTLLPTDGRGATIEVWVTPLSFKSWSRVVDFGTGSEGTGKDFYFSFNDGNNNASARTHFRAIGTSLDCYISTALTPGRTYHLALVFAPQPDGTFLNTAYIHDATTGELLNVGQGKCAAGWTLANIPQENGCWLGHSSYASNNDPDARYHEVRIHHRPMSAAQTEASCLAGPDAVYYFRKKGAGTLTMTGANTYTVGTAVDAGTLKLASGATLPATEMWAGADATLDLNGTAQTARELGGTGTVKGGTLAVTETIQPGGRKAVGTLTVDGTSLTSGTLVVDLDANGASDCLAATGTLDLSGLSLALGDVTALDETKVYTIATATEVTGTFAHADIPKKWRVSVLGSQVKLGYANGTILYFR